MKNLNFFALARNDFSQFGGRFSPLHGSAISAGPRNQDLRMCAKLGFSEVRRDESGCFEERREREKTRQGEGNQTEREYRKSSKRRVKNSRKCPKDSKQRENLECVAEN